MNDYEKLMRKCLTLAKKGAGKTSPNPMVGCVVLDKTGKIISTGYHHKYGQNHAERDALLKLKNKEEENGTLVVNLEPCSHYGKTPPCVDLIIERKLKRVVIGALDSNPKVNGISKLKQAGIEVICGVLENDCRKLNEVFFTNMEKNRIFVAIKTATTIDGKIATSSGDSKWITSDKSRAYARKLRTLYDAILTSSSTVVCDNPEMKHKCKIIIDRKLKTNFDMNIYKQGRIILVTDKTPKTCPKNVEIIKYNFDTLLDTLYQMGIKSVFVESGGKLAGSFLKTGKTDKLYHFTAAKITNDNSSKSCFDGDKITEISQSKTFKLEGIKQFGDDYLSIYSSS